MQYLVMFCVTATWRTEHSLQLHSVWPKYLLPAGGGREGAVPTKFRGSLHNIRRRRLSNTSAVSLCLMVVGTKYCSNYCEIPSSPLVWWREVWCSVWWRVEEMRRRMLVTSHLHHMEPPARWATSGAREGWAGLAGLGWAGRGMRSFLLTKACSLLLDNCSVFSCLPQPAIWPSGLFYKSIQPRNRRYGSASLYF